MSHNYKASSLNYALEVLSCEGESGFGYIHVYLFVCVYVCMYVCFTSVRGFCWSNSTASFGGFVDFLAPRPFSLISGFFASS